MKITAQNVILAAGAALLVLALSVILRSPRVDRDWEHGLSRAPVFESLSTQQMLIRDLRAFEFDRDGRASAQWRDETIDPANLREIWFFVEPFEAWDGAAHSFLSFVFAEDTDQPGAAPRAKTKTLSVSVEARREKGEAYSGINGIFNAYELVYIWSSEKDILTRIAVSLDHELYAYQLKVTPEQAHEIFAHFVERTNQLAETPRFYNTLTSNCTNELAKAVNNAFPGALPWHYSHVLTGYSAIRLNRLGFLGLKDADATTLKADAAIGETVRIHAHRAEDAFSTAWRSALDERANAAPH